MPSLYKRLARGARGERGAVLVLSALMMTVMVGFMGLGLDVGTLYYQRRVMQTGADAGALGGGTEILRGQTGLISSSARTATSENGFLHDTDNVTVTVNHPPLSGPYAGDTEAIEVLIDQPNPTYFMRLFSWTSVDVSARAVAWAGANDKNCIYVMEETEEDAFSYNSSARLEAECGLRVNSSDSWGTHLTSNSLVKVSSASLTGGYVEESSSVLDAEGGVYSNAWPRSPDPLAYLEEPEYAGCDFVDLELDEVAVTLWPGVYCGTLTVKNNTHVTLMPGVYVIVGGPLKTESNAVVVGVGVTIFLTESPDYPFEPMSFQSSSVLDLTAPTSGPYAGILFWGDDDAGEEDDMHRFESNSTHHLEGALYFPRHILSIESSSVITAAYTIIVARELRGDSNSFLDMHVDYSSLAGGSPLKRLTLVE